MTFNEFLPLLGSGQEGTGHVLESLQQALWRLCGLLISTIPVLVRSIATTSKTSCVSMGNNLKTLLFPSRKDNALSQKDSKRGVSYLERIGYGSSSRIWRA